MNFKNIDWSKVKLLMHFKSSSHPDDVSHYTTFLFLNGNTSCNCLGWTVGIKNRGMTLEERMKNHICKHAKMIAGIIPVDTNLIKTKDEFLGEAVMSLKKTGGYVNESNIKRLKACITPAGFKRDIEI